MITKEEIIDIMNKREDRLEGWLNNNPEKLSLKTLKQELKNWHKESGMIINYFCILCVFSITSL